MYLLKFVLSSFFIRYGIIPTLTERITAQYTPDSQREAYKKSAFTKCFDRIFRTSRSKTAAGCFKWGNILPIKSYQPNSNILHIELIPSFLNAAERSDSISVDLALIILPLATITIRNPRLIFAFLSERR